MAANHPLCNIFTQVIAAAFDVTNGINAADAIAELIKHHVDDFVSLETFDAIQTALMNIELQVQREEDVRVVTEHSVIGVTPEGKRVITPTSEAAYDKLLEMGFRSHVESIVYAADRSIPTIVKHNVVTVKTVIPGFDSIEC
jgi:hypothetical protein